MCQKMINGRLIIGSNMSTRTLEDGTVVLFSYDTAVAAVAPSGRMVKTSKRWSNTTTKQVNKWGARDAQEVAQGILDALGRGQTDGTLFA